jgi:hypothetical protein
MCDSFAPVTNRICGTTRDCTGVCCINTSGTYCVSQIYSDFCVGYRPGYFFILTIFASVDMLSYIISRISGKVRISFWTLCNDLLAAFLFTAFIDGVKCVSESSSGLTIAMMVGGMILSLIRGVLLSFAPNQIFHCFKCCTDKEGACGLYHGIQRNLYFMHQNIYNEQETRERIVNTVTEAPIVSIAGDIFERSRVTVVNRLASSKQNESWVSTPYTEIVSYGTWQEEAPDVTIPKGNTLLVKTNIHAEFDYEDERALQARLNQLKDEVSSTGRECDFYVTTSIPTAEDAVIGSRTESVPCMVSFGASSCAHGVWLLLSFVGLVCPFELFWTLYITPIELYSIKKISLQNRYRNMKETPEMNPPIVTFN